MPTFITYSDELTHIGIARQSVWGVAEANSVTFKELGAPKGVIPNPGVTISDLDLNRASRIQNSADLHVDALSGPATLTIPELIVKREWFKDILFAFFQNKISEGTTPFLARYGFHASQPDFMANGGFFLTIGWKSPITGKGFKISSAIIKSMTVVLDKSSKDLQSLVRLKNIQFIGKKFDKDQTFTGTWTQETTHDYHSWAFTADVDTIPFNWETIEIMLDNGAKPESLDSDGTPLTFFLDPPKMSFATLKLKTWYNPTSQAFIDNHIAGTIMHVQAQNPACAGILDHFTIDAYGIVQTPPTKTENKQFMQELDLALCDTIVSQSEAPAILIEHADGVDQTP